MFRFLKQAREFLKRRGTRREISVSDDGIVLKAPDSSSCAVIPWNSISNIIIFKRDALTYDVICMQIKYDGLVLEVDEETLGWTSLTESLGLYLPTSLPATNWFSEVAFPAFDANAKTIYSR